MLGRVVRALDEEGSVLGIERAKPRAGNRRADIPEFLRPFVQRLSIGQAPSAWLFRQDRNPGRPRRQQSVFRRVRELCERAAVPPICTHSLRGMNATLNVQAGASEDYVARSIGHTSFGITLRHYVDPTVQATIEARRIDAVLARVRGAALSQPDAPPVSLGDLVQSLSSEKRAEPLHALSLQHPVQ